MNDEYLQLHLPRIRHNIIFNIRDCLFHRIGVIKSNMLEVELMKITHGRYYYQFHDVVEKLRHEDNSCWICGSTKNVKPHHITRVKESDKQYAAKSNIVLLCQHHHQKFHQRYGSGKGVNRHNLDKFAKSEHILEMQKLWKENQILKQTSQDYEDVVSDWFIENWPILSEEQRQSAHLELGIEVTEDSVE